MKKQKTGRSDVGRPDAVGPEACGPAAGWLGAALALGLLLALLTGIIRLFACNGGLLGREMLRFAPPERTGLAETEYAAMGDHIAGFLAGREKDFQVMLRAPRGVKYPAFHDYEIAHMEDCRSLIRLDGIVCAASLTLAALAAGGLGILGGGAARRAVIRCARKGALRALGAAGLLAAGLTLWALVNFDGLFVTFHRAAFRNDLWLLDPRTDLLIRLMPLEMFIDLGAKGLALFAAVPAAAVLSAALVRRIRGKGDV